MVLGMVAVVEEEPVVNFSITAHTPRDRLIGIRAVVPIITVQITEAVAEIPERQEINNESPVDEVNRPSRDDHGHQKERRRKRGKLDVAPTHIAIATLAQVILDGANIVTKETQKHVAPWILRFAIVAVPVDRQPIDGAAVFILSIRVAFVMPH